MASETIQDLGERLRLFRLSHPIRSLEVSGRQWTSIRAGRGTPSLLVLGGALGHAEFNFGVVAALETSFGIIAPDYPAAQSLNELTAGLSALLDAEGVESAHIVGGSFGGVVAQAFARAYPHRVRSLILSHSGAPRRVPARAITLGLLKCLPAGLLRSMFRRRLRSVLASADPFWTRQFEETVVALSKAEIVSRVEIAAEFGDRYGGGVPQHPDYPVLILDSQDDPLFSASEKESLRALYPRARTHRFEGTGHIAAVLKPDEFARVIEEFINRIASDQSSG